MINHPFGNGVYNLFLVIWRMVYYCHTHIVSTFILKDWNMLEHDHLCSLMVYPKFQRRDNDERAEDQKAHRGFLKRVGSLGLSTLRKMAQDLQFGMGEFTAHVG